MKKSTKALTAGIATVIIAGTSIVAFSGQSGNILGQEEHNLALVNQASLSAEQAITIALADVPGKVIEAEIEKEGDTLIWEIEVLNSENEVYEFEIDANNGSILEKELDND